jgi:hypothetical protein
VAEARRSLPPTRLLVLRYEDLVADPEGARRDVCALLGAPVQAAAADRPERAMTLSREVWKERVFDDVTTDRVGAWTTTLTTRQAREVAAICRRGMLEFGYDGDAPSPVAAVRHLLPLAPADQVRRVRFRRGRRARRRSIRQVQA